MGSSRKYLVIEACHSLGLSLEKGIMSMAYGDQWTNMLQPFWCCLY